MRRLATVYFLFTFGVTRLVLGQPAWLQQLQASVHGDVYTASNTLLFNSLYEVGRLAKSKAKPGIMVLARGSPR